MKAVIRKAYFDGEIVYQVVENPETLNASIEYTTGIKANAVSFCEKHYKGNWEEE